MEILTYASAALVLSAVIVIAFGMIAMRRQTSLTSSRLVGWHQFEMMLDANAKLRNELDAERAARKAEVESVRAELAQFKSDLIAEREARKREQAEAAAARRDYEATTRALLRRIGDLERAVGPDTVADGADEPQPAAIARATEQFLIAHYNRQELALLVHDMGAALDDIGASADDPLPNLVHSIVGYFQRRDRLGDLASRARQRRTNVS